MTPLDSVPGRGAPVFSWMRRLGAWLTRYRGTLLICLAILAAQALIEHGLGRLTLGPDGKLGWWDGDIWGSENSQRVADAYSFSHIAHGILFFALLWLVARKLPLSTRFLMAVLLEAGWEILENSPIIIDRYREATIAQGYVGDSVLNSCSDVGMMMLGFILAGRVRVWVSVAVVLGMEIFCLLWVRDNLTLNIIMLLYPIESLKAWQSAGHPLP